MCSPCQLLSTLHSGIEGVELNSKSARKWAATNEIGVKKHHILLKANFNYVVSSSDGNYCL